MGKKTFMIIVALLLVFVAVVFITNANSQTDPAWEGQWGPQSGRTDFKGMCTTTELQIIIISDPKQGDVNRDGSITNGDVVALYNIMKWAHLADVNGDNKIDQEDVNYLTDFVLRGGDEPKPITRCRSLRVTRICDLDMPR